MYEEGKRFACLELQCVRVPLLQGRHARTRDHCKDASFNEKASMAEVQSYLLCVHHLAMRQQTLFLQCQYHCRHVAPCLVTDCGKKSSSAPYPCPLSCSQNDLKKSNFQTLLRRPLARTRHHCRLCGGIFCGACSCGKLLLPPKFREASPQRVCVNCAALLTPLQPFLAGARMCRHMPPVFGHLVGLEAITPNPSHGAPLDGKFHTNRDTQIEFCYFVDCMFHSVGRIWRKKAQGLICNSSSTPDHSQAK